MRSNTLFALGIALVLTALTAPALAQIDPGILRPVSYHPSNIA